MTAIIHDSYAALAAGEFEDILGPSIEESMLPWENDEETEEENEEEVEYPWWWYFTPGIGPRPPLPEGGVTEIIGEAGEAIASVPGTLWTAAGESIESIGDWLGGTLGTLWDSLKWVLLAILVIVILVAIIVLR